MSFIIFNREFYGILSLFLECITMAEIIETKECTCFCSERTAPHQLCKPFAAYVLIFFYLYYFFIALFPWGFMFCLYT